MSCGWWMTWPANRVYSPDRASTLISNSSAAVDRSAASRASMVRASFSGGSITRLLS